MNLDSHILQLLLRHDCLIIPDFGGFVARSTSASIDWQKNQIKAPSKELVFNRHLQKNDGLLINSVATENQLSFDDAANFVRSELLNWNKTIQGGNRVEIEKVGILYKDSAGNILFEQDRFFNLLLTSFGLSDLKFIAAEPERVIETKVVERPQFAPIPVVETPIISLPVNEVKKEIISPVTKKEVVSAPKEVKMSTRHFPWRALAAAVIIPIGFFAYWIPMKTPVLETGKIALADFNPFRTTNTSSYKVEELNYSPKKTLIDQTFDETVKSISDEVTIYNYKFNDELYIPIRLDKTKENTKLDQKSAPFHLIGGCFASQENASDFVRDCISKGYKAVVLDVKNKLYRVSIAQYSSLELAQQNKSSIAQNGIETWLLRK
jgi:hypothetical protein